MDIQSSYRIPVNTITWHLAEGRKFKLPLVRKEEEEEEELAKEDSNPDENINN